MDLSTDLVTAVNRLTARWVAALPEEATVASGLCAWPLLALLADAASGDARAELAAATAIDADTAAPASATVLTALRGLPGVAAALGLWTHRDVPIRPAWLAGLPDHVHDTLTGDPHADQPRLDAWAAGNTGGLIPRMPITVDADTLLALATALAVETQWQRRFRDGRTRWAGPGPHGGAQVRAVHRDSPDVTEVYLADGVTGVRVAGDHGIDVHVLLGPPAATTAQVLSTGVAAASGARPGTDGAHLPEGTPGPGLRVADVDKTMPGDTCAVSVPRFTVRGSHDLLALPEVFGLASVADRHSGHLPGISDRPLAVQRAGQDAMATFSAVGFRAAAVTTVAVMAGMAMSRATYRARIVTFTVDRPFGFVAAHRETGLVLVTGWVAEPEPDA